MGSQPVPVTLVCQIEMIARGFLAAARFLLALSGGWTSAARWQRQVLTRFNTLISMCRGEQALEPWSLSTV